MNEKIDWRNVPGYFNFDDIYDEVVTRAPASGAHFVEIGVLFGRSMLYMAEAIRRSGKRIAFDAIDKETIATSMVLKHYDQAASVCSAIHLRPELRVEAERAGGVASIARRFIDLSGLGDHVNYISTDGLVQVPRYPDRSLDFAFIDADHSYECTVGLISACLPRMKSTGIIAGHDFDGKEPGVIKAVEETLGKAAVRRRTSFFCEMSQLSLQAP